MKEEMTISVEMCDQLIESTKQAKQAVESEDKDPKGGILDSDKIVRILEEMKGSNLNTASAIVSTCFMALPVPVQLQVHGLLKESMVSAMKRDLLRMAMEAILDKEEK